MDGVGGWVGGVFLPTCDEFIQHDVTSGELVDEFRGGFGKSGVFVGVAPVLF